MATTVSENAQAAPSGVAITLSGGGYRAMLFHLGFVWRMRDAGILSTVDRFASVSGGSITAGMLAIAWPDLKLQDDGASFRKLVADPILTMSGQSIDVAAGLLGRIPGLNGSWVRRAYNRYLFGSAKLRDLPKKPRFVFNATSLHSGKMVRINEEYFADYTTGKWSVDDLLVADAVAASSAFPPVLSPVVFGLSGRKFEAFPESVHKPPENLYLTDGGVYDNLGIEAVWKRHKTIYVSDAGAAFGYEEKGPFLLSTQAMQVTGIMQDQVGALRFRQIRHDFNASSDSPDKRDGFLVSSDFLIDPAPVGGLPYDRTRALALAATKTRLKAIEPPYAKALVNWGYISTDHRIRQKGLPAGHCALPYPDCPVG